MTHSLPPKNMVLYADDDTDDLDLIRELFKVYSEEIELVTFPTGKELMNFIRQLEPFEARPCLIILDINMNGMDGKEVLRRIRNLPEFEEIPVVLFTTSSLPADRAFAQSLKAGYITKPLNRNQILLILDQFIDHCTDEVKRKLRNR